MSPVTAVSKRLLVTSSSHSSLRRASSFLSMTSSVPNATGYTPEVTKALEERPASDEEKVILNAVKELYSCKPTTASYGVYAKDAAFHDPIGIATGIDSIKAQFNALAKFFARAEIPKFRLLQNPSGIPQSTILIDQDVAYYRSADGMSPTKTVNSLLTIETNADHKIVRHTEEWDHKHSTTKEDGFFGMLNEERKRLTAALTDRVVSKDPPQQD